MDLLAVRKKFIELSGRFDLVSSTTTYADNGADFLINQAQRWLDRAIVHVKAHTRHTLNIAVGQYFVFIPSLRVPEHVYISGADAGRVPLERVLADALRTEYPQLVTSAGINTVATKAMGTPLYWAPIVIKNSPSQAVFTAASRTNTYDMDGLTEGDLEDVTGILILPATDAAITVSVKGIFYSRVLNNNYDSSFWSQEHPDILILATFYFLELFYRNAEGAKATLVSLNNMLQGIAYDTADANYSYINQMGG